MITTLTRQEEMLSPSLQVSDGILVQQALAGDQDAFACLVRRYHRTLFRLISSYVREYSDACDILQQVWLQLYLSLTALKPGTTLKAWLFTVARNRCIDHLRRRRPLHFSELEVGEEEGDLPVFLNIVDGDPLPDEAVEDGEAQQVAWCVIQALPSSYHRIVFLRCIAQLSFCEIGQALNIPESRARTYFYRARPLLRAALEAQQGSLPR